MLGTLSDKEFTALLETSRPKLLRYATRLTQNLPDAQDLTQSTLLRAWAARHTYRAQYPMGWLGTIMRHVLIDQKRHKQPATEPLSDRHDTIAVEPAALAAVALGEARTAIARLKPHHRRLLLLVRVHGCTYQHAAAQLGVPIGTVRSGLYRADAALRRLVEAP